MISWVLALAMCLSWVSDDGLEDVVRRLASPEADERLRAQRELAPLLFKPQALPLVLGVYDSVPMESRMRIRDLVSGNPAYASSLIEICLHGDSDVKQAARSLLDELMLSHIARTQLRSESDPRATPDPPLESGVVVGLRWPFGADIELSCAVDWIQNTVGANKPIVLSPRLGDVRAVTPMELLPSTASALLSRLLRRRGLVLLDLGLVHLVVSQQDGDAFQGRLEGDGEQRINRDSLWASYLIEQLLGETDHPEAGGRKAALFAALHLPGAADVAATWSENNQRIESLAEMIGIGARMSNPRRLLPFLRSESTPALRRQVLLALESRPVDARSLVPELLSDEDPVRRRAGIYLAGRLEIVGVAQVLRELLHDQDRGVRLASALALIPLSTDRKADADRVVKLLALDGVRLQDLRQVLEVVCNADRALGVSAIPLLESEDSGARMVGAAVLGLDEELEFSESDSLPSIESDSRMAAAYAVGKIIGGSKEFPSTHVVTVRLHPDEESAALAYLLASEISTYDRDRFVPEVTALVNRTGDPMAMRVVTTVATMACLDGENYQAGITRTLLARVQKKTRDSEDAAAELWDILTEELQGASPRWLMASRFPVTP